MGAPEVSGRLGLGRLGSDFCRRGFGHHEGAGQRRIERFLAHMRVLAYAMTVVLSCGVLVSGNIDGFAYTTLIRSELDAEAAGALGQSLTQAGAAEDMVAMVSAPRRIGRNIRARLRSAGWRPFRVDPIPGCEPGGSREAPLDVCGTLHAFGLSDYEAVVFIDPYSLVITNPDRAFWQVISSLGSDRPVAAPSDGVSYATAVLLPSPELALSLRLQSTSASSLAAVLRDTFGDGGTRSGAGSATATALPRELSVWDAAAGPSAARACSASAQGVAARLSADADEPIIIHFRPDAPFMPWSDRAPASIGTVDTDSKGGDMAVQVGQRECALADQKGRFAYREAWLRAHNLAAARVKRSGAVL